VPILINVHLGDDVIERVVNENTEFALIIRREYQSDGISFLTDPDSGLQIGYMKRESGFRIAPHVHLPVPRQVMMTQEVLFIKRGRVRVDFYDDDKKYLESRLLQTGDIVFLECGGHGLEMLEESEILEVKQGPYVGDGDKERFSGVPSDLVNIKV